jgi:DNA repair protein RadC
MRPFASALPGRPETASRPGLDDRPREKLERLGVTALGDNELVAIVLGHGRAGCDALELANRVLAVAGSPHRLSRTSLDELEGIPGVGPALASRIRAAIELGRRTLWVPPPRRMVFADPAAAAAYLLPRYGSHAQERFGAMYLDAGRHLLFARILSEGTQDASLAHPRDVFRPAVFAGASGVILFHNHPSGSVVPSPEDVSLTRRLVVAGRWLGVAVVDHLVLADTSYYSMQAAGVL